MEREWEEGEKMKKGGEQMKEGRGREGGQQMKGTTLASWA